MNAVFIAITAFPYAGDALKTASTIATALPLLDASARSAARALLGIVANDEAIVDGFEDTYEDLIDILRDSHVTDAKIVVLLMHNDADLLERSLNEARSSHRWVVPASPTKMWEGFVPQYHVTGKAGELQLQTLVGGTTRQKCTRLDWLPAQSNGQKPCRFIDVRVEVAIPDTDDEFDLFAYESKVGRWGSSAFSVRQVERDHGMLQWRVAEGAEWHFFGSSRSNKIGPSEEVLLALKQAQLPFNIHLPPL